MMRNRDGFCAIKPGPVAIIRSSPIQQADPLVQRAYENTGAADTHHAPESDGKGMIFLRNRDGKRNAWLVVQEVLVIEKWYSQEGVDRMLKLAIDGEL